MTHRILIADPLDDEGLDLLRPHAELVILPTISQEDLVKTIGEFDALIVRSRAKVTADVIKAGAATGRLRVVGRAGVGVDNIDVNAATAAGVIVVNAPTGNVVAAAEHAIAMLLAIARRIPEADRSVHAGEWKRTKFVGTEVRNKRLGLVGLGLLGPALKVVLLAPVHAAHLLQADDVGVHLLHGVHHVVDLQPAARADATHPLVDVPGGDAQEVVGAHAANCGSSRIASALEGEKHRSAASRQGSQVWSVCSRGLKVTGVPAGTRRPNTCSVLRVTPGA